MTFFRHWKFKRVIFCLILLVVLLIITVDVYYGSLWQSLSSLQTTKEMPKTMQFKLRGKNMVVQHIRQPNEAELLQDRRIQELFFMMKHNIPANEKVFDKVPISESQSHTNQSVTNSTNKSHFLKKQNQTLKYHKRDYKQDVVVAVPVNNTRGLVSLTSSPLLKHCSTNSNDNITKSIANMNVHAVKFRHNATQAKRKKTNKGNSILINRININCRNDEYVYLYYDGKIISVPISLNSTEVVQPTNKYSQMISEQNNDTACPFYVYCIGRLGNQMFLYASMYGLSRFTKRPAIFIVDHHFRAMFPHSSVPVITPDEWEEHLNTTDVYGVVEKVSGAFSKNVVNALVRVKEHLLVGWYLQSPVYFHAYRKEILREFTFNNTFAYKANAMLHKIKELYNKTEARKAHSQKEIQFVGIHIRRGDMANEENYLRGFRLPTIKYFQKALNYFRQNHSPVVFVVASNGMQWAIDTLSMISKGDIFYSVTAEAALDMALLTSCNHSITSTGTYSWWVSYLTKGKAIYFKDQYAPGTYMGKVENTNERFLENWIGLQN